MDAARILGIKQDDYDNALDRVSNIEKNAIDDGEFRPYRISQNIDAAFQLNADKMGVANPLNKAYATLEKIDTQLSSVSLDDLFPDITNPLIPMGLGLPLSIPGTGASNTPNLDPNVLRSSVNINNNTTSQSNFDKLFPNG